MSKKVNNTPNHGYPDTFSFISFRRENNGGFVFNPYLYNEKWVDCLGFDVLKLSDGDHSVSDITKVISRLHRLDLSESERIVYSRLQELDGYYSLKWRDTPIHKHSAFSKKREYKHSININNYYSAPLSVLWDLTYRCNMRCQHCLIGNFTPGKEMELDEIEKVLQKLKKMRVFRINFSGGEPLLREDLLDILKMTSELNFGVTLSTNGFLLDTKLIEKLKNLNVYCYQISLDGIGETHDTFRGLDGAYEKAVGILRAASRMGLYTIMSTMITTQNLSEIKDLLDLSVSLGVSSFKLNAFMPVGRGSETREKLAVPNDKLRALAEEIIERKALYEDRLDMQLGALCPWLLNPEPYMQIKGMTDSYKLRCSAGHTTLIIAPDGNVYPCPYLTDFSLGNILVKPMDEIWNNNTGILGKFRNLHQEDLKGKCRDCRYVPTECNGGCRAAAYIENGDLYGEDPFCWKNPN